MNDCCVGGSATGGIRGARWGTRFGPWPSRGGRTLGAREFDLGLAGQQGQDHLRPQRRDGSNQLLGRTVQLEVALRVDDVVAKLDQVREALHALKAQRDVGRSNQDGINHLPHSKEVGGCPDHHDARGNRQALRAEQLAQCPLELDGQVRRREGVLDRPAQLLRVAHPRHYVNASPRVGAHRCAGMPGAQRCEFLGLVKEPIV